MINRLNLKKYTKDTSGQFSILMAVGLSVIMLGSAVAIDTAALQKTKTRLFNIADSAALAGAAASEMSNAQRVAVVQEAIEINSGPELMALIGARPTITFDDAQREVTVGFDIESKTLLSGFLGKSTLPVNAVSVASYSQASVNPVSISFALDVSGSMGWETTDGEVKIDALKDSVNLMFREIESQIDDPNQLNQTMRTGMSAYNTSLRARSRMDAGWRGVARSVNRLSDGGGTNSTPSLDFAYDQIIRDRQFRRANDPAYNPSRTKEFVIFMTDGDNNQSNWDDSSYDVCVRMKNDGIEVFTVAFAAPAKGQALLMDCASANKNSAAGRIPNCRNDLLRGNNINACRNAILPSKDDYFFDASNAAAFKEAFRDIGKEIVERGVRIKS